MGPLDVQYQVTRGPQSPRRTLTPGLVTHTMGVTYEGELRRWFETEPMIWGDRRVALGDYAPDKSPDTISACSPVPFQNPPGRDSISSGADGKTWTHPPISSGTFPPALSTGASLVRTQANGQ